MQRTLQHVDTRELRYEFYQLRNTMLFLLPYLAMIIGLYGYESAWIAFLLYHAFIVFMMSRKGDSKYWKQLLTGWEWKSGLVLILFGLGGGVLLYILAPYAHVNSVMITPVLERLGLQGFPWLLFVLYHFLVNPWFEEVFWRGKLGSKNKGLVWNDVFFAGYHMLVLVLFLAWYWMILAFSLYQMETDCSYLPQ